MQYTVAACGDPSPLHAALLMGWPGRLDNVSLLRHSLERPSWWVEACAVNLNGDHPCSDSMGLVPVRCGRVLVVSPAYPAITWALSDLYPQMGNWQTLYRLPN